MGQVLKKCQSNLIRIISHQVSGIAKETNTDCCVLQHLTVECNITFFLLPVWFQDFYDQIEGHSNKSESGKLSCAWHDAKTYSISDLLSNLWQIMWKLRDQRYLCLQTFSTSRCPLICSVKFSPCFRGGRGRILPFRARLSPGSI